MLAGISVVIVLPLALVLLWAGTYHFLPDSRLARLTICFGVLIALTANFNPLTDIAVAAFVAGIALILSMLEWAVSRPAR